MVKKSKLENETTEEIISKPKTRLDIYTDKNGNYALKNDVEFVYKSNPEAKYVYNIGFKKVVLDEIDIEQLGAQVVEEMRNASVGK